MELSDFLFRGLAALFLGSLIGAERQWRHRLAGLKTNALVCAGAMLFVSASFFFQHELGTTRIAAQVVSGIGFLGAGVMFRDGITVKGLNTAATLWCAAAVGVLTGAGALKEAGVATAIIVIANVVLRDIASRMDLSMGYAENSSTRYQLTIQTQDATLLDHLRAKLISVAEQHQCQVLSIETTVVPEHKVVAVLSTEHPNFREVEKMAQRLRQPQTIVNWSAVSHV